MPAQEEKKPKAAPAAPKKTVTLPENDMIALMAAAILPGYMENGRLTTHDSYGSAVASAEELYRRTRQLGS